MNRQIFPACLSLLILSSSAMAESNRFALVIGNGNYEQGQLKNPANDAKLVSKSLQDLGFEVESKVDLDQQEMEETISSFSRRLPKNSFAFFFFAGHGIQAKKANFLIPVGATLNSESSLKYRTVPLDFVRDELENSKSNLNVVVLDCCRNNPFERSWNRSLGQRGFAPLPPVPEGTVIAFATGEGKTAADGQGENSPYTRELASAMSARPAEGLSLVEGVFFTLGRTLKPKTEQHPHLYVDSTMPKYYLWQPSKDQVAKATTPNSNAQSNLPPSPGMSSPTSPSLTSSAAKPAIDPPTLPSPKSSHGHDLLDQALRYHSEGEFDYAITAFGALISDPDVSRDVRDQARKGRGGAYLAKGTADSINRAIIDFKAAREPGIQLSVMRSEAELRDSKIVTGRVHRNEIVLLTQSKGDWLWVESVQGSKSRQGWIKCSAFLAATPASTSSAVSIVQPNKNTIIPTGISTEKNAAVVKMHEPRVQSVGTNTTPFTSATSNNRPATTISPSQSIPSTQSSSVMVSFGPDGKPIGTLPSRNSHQVSLPSQQPTNQISGLVPGQSSAQQMVYDQNGNAIQQWSHAPSNRSVQSTGATQQVQTYRVDQFGNPIVSTQQRTTAAAQQSNVRYVDQNGRQIVSGNQQFYKTQQQTYQPQQQQTYRTQQSTNKVFGNQSRQPFQFQNQGSKIFQSPMRSHMERMKSFRFGN